MPVWVKKLGNALLRHPLPYHHPITKTASSPLPFNLFKVNSFVRPLRIRQTHRAVVRRMKKTCSTKRKNRYFIYTEN
ncbi:MAG: hypothetical protein B6D61_00855 [Bacteroidetes bacterium 4484_249]|nr:MAG: hypothetical protein B6D61_00855 [Bacteroidetes bacterium 4484_249]